MLLTVDAIAKSYDASRFWRRAPRQVLERVSFDVRSGECVGLLGASGSGKSTLARIISGIEAPSRGDVRLHGRSVVKRQHRPGALSIVFQDYTTSINPTMTVLEVLAEPLRLAGQTPASVLRDVVAGLLRKVGLSPDLMSRYLHELSGGQAQRVCISRAVASHPDLIILDEAISSLDLPVQVQILDLLEALREEFDLSYLFITHDIQALCYLCQRVLVLQDGRIVESCALEDLARTQHPDVQALLQAVI